MDFPCPAFTVLCIDDCEPTLDVLRASLSAWGYTALTATCSVDGLNLLSSHAVDILVLDYNMLGMNGETVARKARQAYPELPIILFRLFAGRMLAGLVAGGSIGPQGNADFFASHHCHSART